MFRIKMLIYVFFVSTSLIHLACASEPQEEKSQTALLKGTLLATVIIPGEKPLSIKYGEGLKKFDTESLQQIQKQAPLNRFPNTKAIQVSLAITPFSKATDYYTDSTAKFYLDNFANFMDNKINYTPPYRETYGYLTLPSHGDKFPCAILCHGSEGPDASYLKYAESLATQGIASFLFDRFFGELSENNLVNSTAEDQLQLGIESEILKMVGAVKLMQSHLNIDPKTIGFIGWSRGGNVALECSLQKTLNKVYPSFKPAFCINYYTMPLILKNEVPIAPTLFIHGLDDDYTPISKLLAYLNKICNSSIKIKSQAQTTQEFEIKLDGIRLKTLIYADAGHAFDTDLSFDTLIHSNTFENFVEDVFMFTRLKWNDFINESFTDSIPEFMNLSDCCIELCKDGKGFKALVDNEERDWDQLDYFLQTHKKFGVTLKYNTQAGIEAWKSVIRFLKEELQGHCVSSVNAIF